MISRIRRIDRLQLIMDRWKGYLYIKCLKNRPISLALYSLWSELDQVNLFLNQVVYPQLTVILYVVDDRQAVAPKDNCIYRYMRVRSLYSVH